jgi:hypothetical protein
MFKPLKGREHTKAYLKNKDYRKQFKHFQESKIIEWISLLSEVQTIHIKDENFNYILTPSFYDKVYQFTTFSKDMKPLGHKTYNSINEVVRDNSLFWLSEIKIIECVKGAA